MKAPFRLSQPRRSLWRRGALFGAAIAGALLIAVSGSAIWRFIGLQSAASPLKTTARPSKPGSVSKAISQINAQTVQAYSERWNNPQKKTEAQAQRTVRINSETLARRHPAWRLAEAIERGAVSPSSPQITRVLNVGKTGSVGLGAGATAPVDSAPRAIPGVVLRGGAKTVSSPRQLASLDRFLAQSATRDAVRARDEAFLARRALDDAAALARRGAIAQGELPLLPPDVALELLNLRLELLRNLSRTPAERAAARGEIRAIEARYAELLKDQNEAQAASLRAATSEIPAELKRQGLLQIERTARLEAQKAAQTRRSFASETRALQRRDSQTNDALTLALPPLRRVATSNFAPSTPFSSGRVPASQIIETAPNFMASYAPLAGKVAVSSHRNISNRLREKARQDARQWARLCAAQLGARLSQQPKARDATAQALEIVFPTRRG